MRKLCLDAGFACPNRDGRLSRDGCIFCQPRSFSPALAAEPFSLRQQIRVQSERGRARGVERFMAYFQAYSNTYAPLSVLKAAYDTIRDFPEIQALAVGTRPDCVDEAVLELLAGYTEAYEVWVEYGLQSIHSATLQSLNRGHSAEDFFRAVELTRRHPQLKICVHVILGLPGEEEAQEAETAEVLARLRVEGVKLHPLYVATGTTLEGMYAHDEYQPLTEAEYIRRAVRFLERLSPETVIQRLTADCPPDWLVAPHWLLDKRGVIRGIEQRLEAEDTWQGKRRCD